MIIIRPENLDDISVIKEINTIAFNQPAEAELIERLRSQARPFISLVAKVDEIIVGNIIFSAVTFEPAMSDIFAMGLAPMAVLPEYQKQGIGGQLIRAGLNECRRVGAQVVVVLGHSDYYPRFGFVTAKSLGLSCEYPVPDEVFMAQELEIGVLNNRTALVKYHPAFAGL